MRSIRADQPAHVRAAGGPQVSADISGGQAQRSQARDLQVSEVLTDAAPESKHLFRRGPYVGCLGIEAEVLVDPSGEIEQRFGKRPAGQKRLDA